ncbi:T9SS type B sorting domain-containing protein [Maribacter sp. 2308TA10-17]|uniref:T9SS type B sorting domain-containing protein n=1 Tax=Maribacter sp. 2308TA10-17 TaxID=3386276 RepID=UPI0039BD0D11
MIRKLLFFLLVIGVTVSVKAQLSDLHYLPPLKQGQNNAGIRQQAVYLSTPEPTPFTVNVYRGTNNTPIDTFTLSNVNPEVFTMSNGDNNIILVNNANTGIVLNNSGLRFEAPSGNRFYVNYRGSSSAQSASLTSKGRAAMGTRFKWGGVPNRGSHSSKSNTLGIMATEDNTVVNLFGYDPGCEFRVGNNRAGITANTHQITLDANESFVYETYIGTAPTQAHEDGWIGASIVSDKNIVISNGSMNYGRVIGSSNRDAGIDQPVPENRLGKEYVFVRGNGGTNGNTEFPLIIAIADNTQIRINGSATPIATINNGEYFQVPGNLYSGNSAGANMLIETSKDVYAYQCMAGDPNRDYTQGLNFVAPVNCLLPDVMDNIPDIRNMAGTPVTGGMTIIAAVNTPDANIVVTDGNGPVSLPASNPVAGSINWKTFYIPNLNGNVSVQSTGPMAVGFFGSNSARGVAGYFSGFDTVPEVSLEIRGGTGCFVGSEIYEATNSNFDAFQWFKNDQIVPGANSPSYAPEGAGEYFLRGTKGPCTYDSNSILGLYCKPDIHIEKTVDKAEINEGETAIFTIRIQNWGVGPLTNLLVTDNIPTGLSLVSNFTLKGSFVGNTWNIGTLDGGEVAQLQLEVQADEIDTLPLLSLTNTVTHTQDQTDTNLTEDTPSAHIIVHNDYDNDGVIDIVDLDDDNDGVYDEVECENLSFTISGGNAHTSSLTSAENYFILDIFSLDNSFNIQINGTDLAGEIQFQAAAGNFARFLDGSGYGENGIPQIYTLSGSPESPLLRVVVDESGQFQLYGSRISNGPLEPMRLTTPATTFNWNTSGNNDVSINQIVSGPTNMSGVLLTAGCDTDTDGIANHLDLDSDGDGCSDANEFYKEETADGGDGGEYGTGVPVVDSNDGTVNAASYVQVLAPEILLGNTTEDLGGTMDINGQAVDLGDSFEYVLRFQNTGDDNATSYSIRNILPNNITLDNIEVPDGSNITSSHDINTNIVIFTIPDNLVEIGDPEYTIRITVTLASNCSDFVDACSSELENTAYSTYQGVLNTNVFTDENGSNSITACPRTPEVARNSILTGLTDCNLPRTAQLCNDDITLTAGLGFANYNWVLDTNGDGNVDSGDTVLSNGSSNTLTVTSIGNYIVEKSGNGTCPDLIERIEVVRYGTTQTNPIIDYFNQVNNDTDPDNDLQGEIVTCTIDQASLPEIFLCGENDEATIQLSITDADSIEWQKLDEGSCSGTSNNPENCANLNGTCTWDTVSNLSNYTITDSGEYRLIINYPGGCVSRFYFNAFKNNLPINVATPIDILCNTPGNIRVLNLGADYGFQLVDATNSNIIIPFSDNNGPNFDITTSGTYKVQVTQLHPMDGSPEAGTVIVGACIFETEDIGIQEQVFDVALTTTQADCNQLGTITVQALNARPNYNYELRFLDGSNGGLGADAGKQLAVNDNTHTFSNLLPGNYNVITTTQDGCSESNPITVTEIPELTLLAVTSENITCRPGIVNLTPDGGLPSPDYEMAIWSIDGNTSYTNETDVPDSEYQTTASFLFGDSGNPNRAGDYVFIVRDGNGCYAKSASVPVLDLGTITISADNSEIVCADSSTASLTVSASGGNAPYQYSLDGGINYQNTNTFVNLPAGFYTITVMDSSGVPGSGCVETFDHEIEQPFRLTSSATILEDASCNPAGALVKIINTNGGKTPYEYSFNGGTFSGVDEQNLLPGTHNFTVRDALGCTFDMDLTVPTSTTDPTFSSSVDYNCIGEGEITIIPSNNTNFNYNYSLNGTANTPADNNVFNNVADGSHTITIGYSNTTTPDQSTLFLENFGAGPNTQIAEIGPDYCYEPQDGSLVNCNRGPAGILVNGEYTVTNLVTNPISSLTSPQDHSGLTDGRFLAIDISTFSDTGNEVLNSVLWRRENIEVSQNREVTLSFWAYNLKNVTGTGNNPEVLVEIFDNLGALIHSEVTPEIPKNNNDIDWHPRTITFDPGVSTSIDIVFRSNVNSNDGNDLILDDISASQDLEICEKTTDIPVIVEDNKEFSANILGTNDPNCNGGSDGSIRFEVLNFDLAEGFQYSINGSTPTISMVSEVTTSAPLTAGSYTVLIEKLPLTTVCTTDFTVTLGEPTPIMPSLTQTAPYTCFNTGGTLRASATGGTPGYEYQLENTAGIVIRAYQTNTDFVNVPEGDYFVRVQNIGSNKCPVLSSTPVRIDRYEDIDFDLSTICYDGLNNGTITVTVNTGNGGYLFRRDGLGWESPNSATPTSYTFTGLSEGDYDIEVSDAYGCLSIIKPISIVETLTATIATVDASTCADGSITVNANGGDGNYVYAFVPTSDTLDDSDFGTSNTHAVTTANTGDYNVYVRDNGGIDPRCEYQNTATIQNAPVLAFDAPPTDAICFGEFGSITVTITSGRAPYTYQLIDTDNGVSDEIQNSVVGTTRTYFNLLAGNYDVIVTDALGCSVSDLAVTISQPEELTATISGITPADCTGDLNDFGLRFTAYPTTLGDIEFSSDGGTTWVGDNSVPGTSDELRGYLSGDTVYPAMRTVDGSGNTICINTNFPPFVIPYPLDDLDITVLPIIVDCNELQVTVQGREGAAPYEYAISDDPANFNPATATWILGDTIDGDGVTVVPAGHGRHVWVGLIPGKTYVFYVRDSNTCTRQSSVNVNDITTNPMEITSVHESSCFGANNGEITYTITDSDGLTEPQMDWTLYDINDNVIQTSGIIPFSNTINITNLSENEYYIIVTQVDASNAVQCISGSENLLLEELDAITATLNPIQNISCESPGIIRVENIQGGGGTFTYTVTGPAPFTTITGTTDNPIEIPENSPTGDYHIQITDQYGCPSITYTETLTLSPNPIITNLDIDNCGSGTTVTIEPSSVSLFYSIDGGTTFFSNSGVFNNVPEGHHTAVLKDTNGCTVSQSFIVEPTLQATASLAEDLGCGPGQEAEILIEVTAGSGNYEYKIEDSSGTEVVLRGPLPTNPVTELINTDGTYTVYVYDMSVNPECHREFPIEVPPAMIPDFSVNATDVACFDAPNGSITVTPINNGNTPHTYTISPNVATFNSTTSSFDNLPPDTYVITATGVNGCQETRNAVIIQPLAITFTTPAVTPFECSSNNSPTNATISIDISSIGGGSLNYTNYQFEEVTSGVIQNGISNTYIFSDFTGGDVIVRVFDDKGCHGEVTVNVPEFDQMNTPTITIVDPISCAAGENIEINVVGNVTNYLSNPSNYEFRRLPSTTYQASNFFTLLPPDTYTFGARNINTGCEILIEHIVEDPNTIEFSVQKLADAVCYGDDGSIQLNISDPTYTGDYTWTIYDPQGTPADQTDDTVFLPMPSGADPRAPITIQAGSYIVGVIQDGLPSCEQFRSFTITTPLAPITLAPIDLTDVGCSNNNNQGTAYIKPIGGLGLYNIILTNTTTGKIHTEVKGVDSYLFEGLFAGQFTIEIEDALNCPETFVNAFELVVPEIITADPIVVPTLDCEGYSDATISLNLNPSGRNVITNYYYTLNRYTDNSGTILLSSTPPQTSPTFSNQGAGFYNITVTDDMGCPYASEIIEIVDPIETSAMLFISAANSCVNNAELELTAIGGTGPYRWSIDGASFNPMNEINGANTHLFQNVTPGSYEYFVQDSNDCISILSNEIVIKQPEDLTLVRDPSGEVITCFGQSTAVIQVVADGGLGNYQYGLFSDLALTNVVRSYQASGTFADLGADTYYVNVQSDDCPFTPLEIVIEEPTELIVTPIPTDVTCYGRGDGKIEFDIQSGTGPFQYAISPDLDKFEDEGIFENLSPGNYTVIIQDSNGCPISHIVPIDEPDQLIMTLTSTPEICEGEENGTITVAIEPGTGTPPYSTAIDSNSDEDFVMGRTTFENVASGNHWVYVRDANGCLLQDLISVEAGPNLNVASYEVIYECTGDTPTNRLSIVFQDETFDVESAVLSSVDSTDPNDLILGTNHENLAPGSHYIYLVYEECRKTINFEVTEYLPLELNLVQLGLNEITANASEGREGYTYFFNEMNNGDDNTFYIKRTDTYTVRVVDENGCEAIATIDMEFIDIEIPNFFTPDGDGLNDFWIPRNIEQFPDIFIKIYDRYGREVYRIKDDEEGWNGLYQESDLPTGDYWYIIRLNGEDDDREFVGNFTLYR